MPLARKYKSAKPVKGKKAYKTVAKKSTAKNLRQQASEHAARSRAIIAARNRIIAKKAAVKKAAVKKASISISQPSNQDKEGRPRFTGNQIVLLNRESSASQFIKAAAKASMRIANVRDFTGAATPVALSQADGLVFDKLKIAVIPSVNAPQMRAMSARSSGAKAVVHAEPERFVYALASRASTTPFTDDEFATWGIKAVNALSTGASTKTGKGIKIAILDTGINETHPDFAGRIKGSKCFVQRSTLEDGNGHGTHCAGIATANMKSGTTLQYGVASQADLYIAKVLSNQGNGQDSNIFEAIEWAIENGCHIVSMSFGSEIEPGESYYNSYEQAAREALRNNCLLIAAAGNDSDRPRKIRPVNHPANCPSILSVAALTPDLNVSSYSCGGTRLGAVDIAAPGDDILSSWKNGGYRKEFGTSMATPFVAGIAALYAEKYPHFTMRGVKSTLLRYAKKLPLKQTDAGKGLVYFK